MAMHAPAPTDDLTSLAIQSYLGCAVATALVIYCLGARRTVRLYCVCLWVIPIVWCLANATVVSIEHLTEGLAEMGWTKPVKRMDHHLSHTANSFFCSGFERA